MQQPTLGSLFAGIGGFDLGFENAGYRSAWQVELNPINRAVLADWKWGQIYFQFLVPAPYKTKPLQKCRGFVVSGVSTFRPHLRSPAIA
ncbi:DNA cytosine methyltransferase [Pseudomonas sp. 58(2021)]|uniref:DNA cytosine methyltransferase n=1 Tax=Pseudomonas sp. 58(2021) TaxID=2813330 RepID=UPI001FAF3CCF|nr:DNA cytosine methyltransferase [Pseudomonas sp. 58(2021)]